MFLILGTSECKYCLESKKLLDSLSLKYTYVDLSLKFEDDWRTIFSILKSILGSQKTIPIIFKGVEETTVPDALTVESLHALGWTLVGSNFDLEDLINNMDTDISISDDY